MKQIFNIPDIHCASCVMLLEELEDELDAVDNVKVDLGKRTAEIEFDEMLMTGDDVVSAIEKISGYKATTNAS